MNPELCNKLFWLRNDMEEVPKLVMRYLGKRYSFVMVDAPQFKGVGALIGPSENPTKVDVLLCNGNIWSYPAECCKPASANDADKELRLVVLRRNRVACAGSTHVKTLRGRLP